MGFTTDNGMRWRGQTPKGCLGKAAPEEEEKGSVQITELPPGNMEFFGEQRTVGVAWREQSITVCCHLWTSEL